MKMALQLIDEAYSENYEARQNGSRFTRINPDPNPDAGFDLDVDIAKIYN